MLNFSTVMITANAGNRDTYGKARNSYDPGNPKMTDESASKLVQGQLIKRYKRFLADVRLVSGEGKGKIITAHCPNTGSMKNCIEEGADVWLSLSDNPARKHRHTWELIRTRRGHYIGINTHRANHLVYEGLCKGLVRATEGLSKHSPGACLRPGKISH